MLRITNSKDFILTATGIVFILVGMTGIYFFVIRSIKPDLLQLNVFTIYSEYFDTKICTIIKNNQGDELAVSIYLLGWLLILFKQKKTFVNIQSITLITFIVGYLFLHGLAVIYFIVAFLFLLPIIFIINR